MPTAFSTAFDAMATTTKPVKTLDKPNEWVAGVRAPTNHSDTKAEARPEAASTITATFIGHRPVPPSALSVPELPTAGRGEGGGPHSSGAPLNQKGILAT